MTQLSLSHRPKCSTISVSKGTGTMTSKTTAKRRSKRPLVWLPFLLAGLIFLGSIWFCYSAEPKVTALRNVVHYRVVKATGGPRLRTSESSGAITGTIRDPEGKPVVGALVLVASPLGDTYTATSEADGRYRISGVPPGRYVPVAGKRGYNDAIPQICAAGLCYKHVVIVRPGTEATAADLRLAQATSPQIVVDNSLIVSPTVEVETTAPLPGRALRTHFSFERAGLRVNDCWLYEPVALQHRQDLLPMLLLVLPGPGLGTAASPPSTSLRPKGAPLP